MSVLVGFCFCVYKELVMYFVSYVNDEDTSSMKSIQFVLRESFVTIATHCCSVMQYPTTFYDFSCLV